MEEKELQCRFCPEKFRVQVDWKDHITLKHKMDVFPCELCSTVYYSKSEYMQHFDSMHKSDSNRHTCNYCGVSYKWFKFLQKHIAVKHQIESLMQCKKCGEEFYNTNAYERHTKLKHAPGRTFHKCDRCFRSFTAKASVALHEKFDHSPNGFKHFAEYVSENLNLEEGLVTSKRNCYKCDLKFSSALYLFKHFKYAHRRKFYKCCKCDDAVYSTRAGLSIHLHFEHGVSRDHRCSKCTIGHTDVPKTFDSKTNNNKIGAKNVKNSVSDNGHAYWSKMFITQGIPDDLELKRATDVEVNNLRSNIQCLFHILSTVPPSKMRGSGDLLTESVYSINKLRGGLDKDGKRAFIAPEKTSKTYKSIYERNGSDERQRSSRKRKSSNNCDSDKDFLEDKIKNKEKYEKKFVCDICCCRFSSKRNIVDHITKHHNKKCDKKDKFNENVDKKSPFTDKNVEVDSESHKILAQQINEIFFECDNCHDTFTSKRILVTHITKKHCLKSGQETENCDKVTSPSREVWPDTMANFDDQVTERTLSQDNTVLPSKLNQNSETPSNSRDEQNKSDDSKNDSLRYYKCKFCQIEFDSELNLLNHLTESHTVTEDNSAIMYKCDICSDAFENKDSLNIHNTTAHNEAATSNSCDKCSKTFNDKRGLYLHKLRSHGMKNVYSCKKCSFKHSNKRKLHNHLCLAPTTDNLEKSNQDKENATDSPLKGIDYHKMKQQLLKLCKREIESKRTREDPKRIYKCLKCDNKFPKRTLLLAHIRQDHNIHLNKLHKCEKCFAIFKMEDKLKQHIQLKHKPTNLPVIKISKTKMSPIKLDSRKIPSILSNIFQKNGMMFNCKICHSYFPSNELLQRHIQWEHTTNVNMHKCGQCNQVLYSVEDLDLHMNTSHNPESNRTDDVRKWKKKIAINYNQQLDV